MRQSLLIDRQQYEEAAPIAGSGLQHDRFRRYEPIAISRTAQRIFSQPPVTKVQSKYRVRPLFFARIKNRKILVPLGRSDQTSVRRYGPDVVTGNTVTDGRKLMLDAPLQLDPRNPGDAQHCGLPSQEFLAEAVELAPRDASCRRAEKGPQREDLVEVFIHPGLKNQHYIACLSAEFQLCRPVLPTENDEPGFDRQDDDKKCGRGNRNNVPSLEQRLSS